MAERYRDATEEHDAELLALLLNQRLQAGTSMAPVQPVPMDGDLTQSVGTQRASRVEPPIDPRDAAITESYKQRAYDEANMTGGMRFLKRWGAAYLGKDPDKAEFAGREAYMKHQETTKDRDLRERNTKVAEQGVQQRYLDHLGDAIVKFSALDDDTKGKMAPILEPLIQKLSGLARVDTPAGLLRAASKSPEDSMRIINMLQKDPSVTDEEKSALMDYARKNSNKPQEIRAFVKQMEDAVLAREEASMSTADFASAVTEAKTKTGKQQMSVPEFMAHIGELPSAIRTRALSGYLGKNALGVGLVSEKVLEEQAKEQAKNANKDDLLKSVKTVIAGLPSFRALGVPITDFEKLPPDTQGQLVAEAQKYQRDIANEYALNLSGARNLLPEKASPKERETVSNQQVARQLNAEVLKLYNPAYVGPVVGATGKFREKGFGPISPQEAEFRSRVTSLNNATIKLITGAQMSEPEAERIKSELPQVTLPPVTFEARMRQTNDNQILMMHKYRQVLEQTGVDVSKLDPLPPLPQRFQTSPALGLEPPKQPARKRVGEPTQVR